MYIIRDSELRHAPLEDRSIVQPRPRLMPRLRRLLAVRFHAGIKTRVAQGVTDTQHPGVMADFSAACGDD